MIEATYGQTSAESSCMAFVSSMRSRYLQMLATSDISEHVVKYDPSKGGSLTRSEQAVVDKHMADIIRRIGSGEALTDLAHEHNLNPKTLQSRLSNRGLSVRKIRNQKHL